MNITRLNRAKLGADNRLKEERRGCKSHPLYTAYLLDFNLSQGLNAFSSFQRISCVIKERGNNTAPHCSYKSNGLDYVPAITMECYRNSKWGHTIP